ncbi:hypothetical protein [Pantoea ananatis]|uniref:hypothetical protein n=1 Tax=Pantoea ananas TaxID=553 RepID=UPI0023507580|nr:hypothetical protein [Pantoea ananatis]
MKRADTMIITIPKLLFGMLILLFPILSWAGNSRISCTPPPVHDAGRNWSDVSEPIPVPLSDIMEPGMTLSVDPAQVVQCLLIASAVIQSIGNHGTSMPYSISPYLSYIDNQNIIFLMSQMVNNRVIVYSASPSGNHPLYFTPRQPGVINAGDPLFSVTYNSSVALANTSDSGFNVVIPFVAANRMVIVNRNCDFNSQSVSVNLPDYSVAGTSASPVPLNLSCTSAYNVYGTMNLTGTTASGDDTVFTSDGSAQGIGVRFYYNSQPVAANQNLQFGPISGSNTPTNLGLSVAYARTGEHLTAGTVRSRVNLTLTYR